MREKFCGYINSVYGNQLYNAAKVGIEDRDSSFSRVRLFEWGRKYYLIPGNGWR